MVRDRGGLSLKKADNSNNRAELKGFAGGDAENLATKISSPANHSGGSFQSELPLVTIENWLSAEELCQ